MIGPLEPSAETKQQFTVADIENDERGNVLAIGMSYRWHGEIRHSVFENWSDWLDEIIRLSKREKRFRTVYAHNGGGWDWLSLLEFMLKQGRHRFIKIEGCRVQSKLVLLRVLLGSSKSTEKRSRIVLRFADSLYLLRSSLDKLALKLVGIGKVDLAGKMAWDIYREDRKKFYEYLQEDCRLLLLSLEKALQILREKVCKIDGVGLTIGSTALKVFRTGFLKKEIDIPNQESVKQLLREGYRGGRVEVFKYGVFKRVNVYDINSLYPAAMVRCNVPTSNRGDKTGIFRWKLPGVYRIRYRQSKRSVFPVLLYKGTGSYEGEGTYFIPEIDLLRRIDPLAKIELLDGYVFWQADSIFSEFVNSLYSLRLSDKDGPIDLLCKFLLNSLYGKFGQKADREQYLAFSSKEDAREALTDPKRKIIELNNEFTTFAERKTTDVKFEHVGIAGMVTSMARVILYESFLHIPMDRIIYCDTDSIHTTETLPADRITNKLGDFKLEFSGNGCYAGRKLYGLQWPNGEEKIRAKGVSVGGRNGCRLSFADMVSLVNGGEKVCEFRQPSTASEVMHGLNACEFRKRRRTLRMT